MLLVVIASFFIPVASTSPVDALRHWLSVERDKRPDLAAQAFARTALTKDEAGQAAALLWEDYTKHIRQTRAHEWKDKSIKINQLEMKFDYRVFGQKPDHGRSLFISLHGGGSAPKAVNDRQWENQKRLYKPAEGVYLAPRAPNDAWNMWFQPHMDAFFERLILDAVVFEGVDANRVYLTGYSAGGDGVYRLAPRLADRWAAAAMMAGHPGESSALNLRNLPFALHVGEKDSAFERNRRATEWKQRLAELHQQDPQGYVHEAVLHPGKGHWMDREDASAIPWMARFTRNPTPNKVVWHDAGSKNTSCYWLALPKSPRPENFAITATCENNTIRIESKAVPKLLVRFRDVFVDLEQPVIVEVNGKTRFTGKPDRTILTLDATMHERQDRGLMFSSQIEVEIGARE
jgi:poly(3-hydroxybutyrate) depolymerase